MSELKRLHRRSQVNIVDSRVSLWHLYFMIRFPQSLLEVITHRYPAAGCLLLITNPILFFDLHDSPSLGSFSFFFPPPPHRCRATDRMVPIQPHSTECSIIPHLSPKHALKLGMDHRRREGGVLHVSRQKPTVFPEKRIRRAIELDGLTAAAAAAARLFDCEGVSVIQRREREMNMRLGTAFRVRVMQKLVCRRVIREKGRVDGTPWPCERNSRLNRPTETIGEM